MLAAIDVFPEDLSIQPSLNMDLHLTKSPPLLVFKFVIVFHETDTVLFINCK